MIRLNLDYFKAFLIVFLIEICIAIFVHDALKRPFFGDFLAVFFVYFFFKATIKISKIQALVFTFLISFGLEFLQLTHFLEHSRLKSHKIIIIVLGSSFDVRDLLAYALGMLVIFYFETKIIRNGNQK